jgi:hypothetical protein
VSIAGALEQTAARSLALAVRRNCSDLKHTTLASRVTALALNRKAGRKDSV